jgi:hypothetical protein
MSQLASFVDLFCSTVYSQQQHNDALVSIVEGIVKQRSFGIADVVEAVMRLF